MERESQEERRVGKMCEKKGSMKIKKRRGNKE